MQRPSLQRFVDLLGGRGRRSAGRVAGDPPSGNGASSLHLRWDDAALRRGVREVSVTLEVVEAPTVPRLYFWALQADFRALQADFRALQADVRALQADVRALQADVPALQADVAGASGPAGGAHLGLQWHPQHPGSTAVNWGGYDAAGRELAGSSSTLPSASRNANTRDLRWRPGVPYRLRIRRVDVGGRVPVWRGSVTGDDGDEVVVRDLHPAADRIVGAVMWSEVFARCDHPSTAVRWSAPAAVTLDGSEVAIERVSVNYQSHHDGGCANTDSSPDSTGLVQRTNSRRTTPQGTVLPVPGAAPRVRSGP